MKIQERVENRLTLLPITIGIVSFVTKQKKVKNIFYKNPIACGDSPYIAPDNHRNCFFCIKKKKNVITRPRYNAPRASSAASLDLTLQGELKYLNHFAFENCVYAKENQKNELLDDSKFLEIRLAL